MAEFLFEIGLEEIPARMIAGAQAELQKRVVAMLERERLMSAGVATKSLACKSFSTPRRLAVWVGNVLARQEDVSEEMLGPAVKIAYKDGVPAPAAVAFAKKAGVGVDELKTVATPKGEYLAATAVKAGRGAAEVIAAELPKELVKIYWAKNMYWRPGKPERFVRPVRWMLALLGDAVVPVEFAGYTAANVTYGHRVLFGDAEITVASPEDYEGALLDAFVVADVEARRQRIRKALDKACRGIEGARWREDHALVDKLTHLTEWASERSVIAGGFEPEYLKLPEEVLVTVMRDHQSYFAVEGTDGKLAAHFLAVLNMQADDAGLAVIRHGNERVLRARFNDAKFFWEFDQRVSLLDRQELLKNVTFQKELGTYFLKSQAILSTARILVNYLTSRGTNVDQNVVDTAALLAKADLTTDLVKEFTELQGIVGGLYAETQGLGTGVASAIYDQYKPKSMEDSVPQTIEGAVIAIADKASNISGLFGLKMEPTGSKDPFALRRAANGIVKILAEVDVPISLKDVALSSCTAFPAKLTPEHLISRMSDFFDERVEFYLRDVKGFTYDVVKAVMMVGADNVRDAVARAEAVTAVRGSDDFAAVSAAFKRMKNILAQAGEKGIAAGAGVDAVLLTEPTERALAERSAELAVQVKKLRGEKKYAAALESIATLRPQVDAFFDAVMVMAPDAAVRANRLALLQKVLEDFSGIADFSEIVVAG